MITATEPLGPSDLSEDALGRLQLAERVASSKTFARSDQLQKLLLHVCEMAIAGREDELHEQTIGCQIFGRPSHYDPGVDGIVRSHATRLRQRLGLYFTSEGAHEALRIEIPRGGYVPRFVPVETTVDPLPLLLPSSTVNVCSFPVTEIHPPTKPVSRYAAAFLGGLVFASVLLVLALHLRRDLEVRRSVSGFQQTPIEQQFWATLFRPKERTLLITGDSGLVLYETLSHREVSLADYVTGTYRVTQFHAGRDAALPARELAAEFGARRYTSAVDAEVAQQLSHLPQWSSEHSQTIFARDLRPSDANNTNLILIGSREANPWISLIESQMNFVLRPDSNGEFRFINRAPNPGEQSQYSTNDQAGNLGSSIVFGDVTYAPNPSGQGMILALSGLWMSGTQSASSFVLSSDRFSEFLRSIERKNGTLPSFEILIASQNLGGTSASATVLARRVGR